jgi:hypothetical protein
MGRKIARKQKGMKITGHESRCCVSQVYQNMKPQERLKTNKIEIFKIVIRFVFDDGNALGNVNDLALLY